MNTWWCWKTIWPNLLKHCINWDMLSWNSILMDRLIWEIETVVTRWEWKYEIESWGNCDDRNSFLLIRVRVWVNNLAPHTKRWLTLRCFEWRIAFSCQGQRSCLAERDRDPWRERKRFCYSVMTVGRKNFQAYTLVKTTGLIVMQYTEIRATKIFLSNGNYIYITMCYIVFYHILTTYL